MNGSLKYCFYATLLDSFQSWLSSSEIYQEYWGFSEDPSKTEDEFEKEQLQSLINRINRMPMTWEESEAADRGTAFNEVVDCVIHHRKSEMMEIKTLDESGMISASYNKRTFIFPIALVREFANYFKGAFSQVRVESEITTKYGDVLIYGVIDELMPDSIHDIKTTSKYKVGKYRNNWQHIIYPFCMGNGCNDFEYNIAVFNGTSCSTFTEHYRFIPVLAVPKLRGMCEQFIEFIESHRDSITDKKIFNQHEELCH